MFCIHLIPVVFFCWKNAVRLILSLKKFAGNLCKYYLCSAKTVDIAQLVRATDCGSVGRGFEPHFPPEERTPEAEFSFFVFVIMDTAGF